MEENINIEEDFDIEIPEETYVEVVPTKSDKKSNKKSDKKIIRNESIKVEDIDKEKDSVFNCLRNARVIVRFLPKEGGLINNPKHVLYGGMSENSSRTFTVPRLTSGMLVNVLTDKEKDYLEDVMGLEYNTLSIYKKKDNFWDGSNEEGINKVRLTKQDNFLTLSSPEDYIKYKILLANKNYIAPSIAALHNNPKATYQFVIIEEGEEDRVAKSKLDVKMLCYKEYGKIENNTDILRTIIETIDGRPLSSNVKLTFLQTRIDNLITADSNLFYKVITDPLLNNRVLIKNAVNAGIIANRSNLYFLIDGNMPLCENNEDSNIHNAAKYLASPKRQELKFAIENKLKQ